MAYIGRSPNTVGISKLDNLTFNGVATVFPIAQGGIPVVAGSPYALIVSINGVVQNPGIDFTVSESTLTFVTAPNAGADFFGIALGTSFTLSTVADNSISVGKLDPTSADAIRGDFSVLSVTGTNTLSAISASAPSSYKVGATYRFLASGTNTGATTININGLGDVSITKSGAVALSGGEIVVNSVIQITYDGTRFQLVSGAGGSGTGNAFAQNNLNVPAGTGVSLVGPLELSGTTTISGRLVIL